MARNALERAADPDTHRSELLRLAQDSLESAAAVAANPSIDEEVAEVLLERRSRRISKVVASNPNAPFAVLVALAKAHPVEVAENPAFQFVIAADPSCIKDIDCESLARVAKAPAVDPRCLAIIAQATSSSDVRYAITENPRAPLSALRSIAATAGSDAVSLNRNWQPRAAETWDARTIRTLRVGPCHGSDVLLSLLARAGAIDSAIRAAALATASEDVRAVAIAKRLLPAEAEFILADPDVPAAKEAIASAMIARGPRWPELLEELGLCRYRPNFLCRVEPGDGLLHRTASSDDVHRAFAQHHDYYRKRDWTPSKKGIGPWCAIAAHPRVSALTLEAMINASPRQAELRLIATRSHAATPRLRFLSRLFDLVPDARLIDAPWFDPIAHLRRDFHLIFPITLASYSKSEREEVRVTVAARPDLDPDVVTRLAADSSPLVRLAIAGSESLTDESLVRALCTDSRMSVRAAVVGRHGPLPDAVRATLLADESMEVRTAFATRRDATDAEQLALASDKSAAVRLALAVNRSITADAIAGLRSDLTVDLVVALAENPSVSLAVMAALIEQLPSLVLRALRDRGDALLGKQVTPLDLGTVVALAAEKGSKLALSHPSCPPELIERMFDPSAEWTERALIAANPATPETVRSKLRNDAYWPVAEAAASIE